MLSHNWWKNKQLQQPSMKRVLLLLIRTTGVDFKIWWLSHYASGGPQWYKQQQQQLTSTILMLRVATITGVHSCVSQWDTEKSTDFPMPQDHWPLTWILITVLKQILIVSSSSLASFNGVLPADMVSVAESVVRLSIWVIRLEAWDTPKGGACGDTNHSQNKVNPLKLMTVDNEMATLELKWRG